MKYLFLSFALGWVTLLGAQSAHGRAYTNSPIYAQVGLGLFPSFGAFMAEPSLAVGYRINPGVGVGIEFRQPSGGNESFSDVANVVGVQVRRQFDSGWWGALGGGLVLSASEGDDGFTDNEYKSGGQYASLDLGYQLRWGLTLGVYGTAVWGTTHYDRVYNFDTEVYERTGSTHVHSFPSMGFKLGFAFPARGRRR